MSAAAAPRYRPRFTARRLKSEEPIFIGPLGLAASMIRQAIEDAQGARCDSHNHAFLREEARCWLRSGAWEGMVANMGAEPRRLRRELERRFEWMKESA